MKGLLIFHHISSRTGNKEAIVFVSINIDEEKVININIVNKFTWGCFELGYTTFILNFVFLN